MPNFLELILNREGFSHKITKIELAFEEEFLCSATHFLNAIVGILPHPPLAGQKGNIPPHLYGGYGDPGCCSQPLGESAGKPSSVNKLSSFPPHHQLSPVRN